MAYFEAIVGNSQEDAMEKAKQFTAGLDHMTQPSIYGHRVVHYPDGKIEYVVTVKTAIAKAEGRS
jgi:hypothetical protein